MAATNKCLAQSNNPRTVTWDENHFGRLKLIDRINTGALDNPDACALAPL
jgi:hypothetical protein